MIYELKFNAVEHDYLIGYTLRAFSDEDILIHEANIDKGSNQLIITSEHKKYSICNSFKLDEKAYVDDYYKMKVYVNNGALTDEQFKYDRPTNSIIINYKVKLSESDEIIVEYYQNIYKTTIDIDCKNPNFELIKVYGDTYNLGSHTFI